ncbi:MAG: hypothetical protein K2K02_02185 [Ruminococcus sp.]|nr:hypothetical protein [Ruminococcus sp.]
MTDKETEFLSKRMTQLREKNGIKSLQAMMEQSNFFTNDRQGRHYAL